MNVNNTNPMQQTQMRKMDGTGNGNGNGAMNKMMNETLSLVPEETKTEIQSLMQALSPEEKQSAKAQMAQIESANMTVEDLTAAIMDIFKPQEENSKSSYPSSFSVYA